ncbi:Intron-binding protein aquarius [Danaus plexippus plexippus]|uniref:RNA helicase aquarius n=1 Tax=Danaus plexippus plexippus TaxID=278856 RepID=A0A212F749_DANPL|nr:Intron-binding protein aquarius [Danaus plexippus plexippus]
MLKFYARFEISDETGDPMTDRDMTLQHYSRITSLQKAAFTKFPDLRLFSLANVASVDTRESLQKHFGNLSDKALRAIATYLNLVPTEGKEDEAPWHRLDKDFLRELLISRHERRISQLEELNSMPLYPTEKVVWDEHVVPTEVYSGERCLALPKLNLQFLTLHDYLLRNFNLFRLESTYEIRQDIEDAVYRLSPWKSEDGTVIFGGWARMAHPIQSFAVVEVAKPNIGEKAPSRVRADVTVTLSVRNEIKHEWESLRKHDVCFLITVRPSEGIGTKYDYKKSMVDQAGIVYIRGCEVEGMLDAGGRVIEDGPEPRPELEGDSRTFRLLLDPNQYRLDLDEASKGKEAGIVYIRGCEVEGMLDAGGRVIEDGPEPRPELEGDSRTFRLLLDPNQYRLDLDEASKGKEDVYETFNIVVRRKPKENNFKAVLETIRELMNTECVVPEWLHDIVLGYGDPGQAHYTRMPNEIPTLDFNDTFLDMEHLRNSFPGHEIKVQTDDPRKLVRPFKLTFENVLRKQRGETDMDEEEPKKVIVVEPHVLPKRGPYLYNEPKKNNILFTPTQVEAIRSGMQPGLTVVVGPPGTGKTDVAVQIISNLYHNFPSQRTLVVTHSNQALNQLFEKVAELDVDERHLLRLGHGEEALQTDKDFSRYGRVNYVLAKRLELLGQVSRLQTTLGAGGEAGGFIIIGHVIIEGSCENICIFLPRSGSSLSIQLHIRHTESHHPREKALFHITVLLESHYNFNNYPVLILISLKIKCKLISVVFVVLERSLAHCFVCFKYDNILMEESAQILEIETFIPLLLQNPQDGRSRLKRWIMIGDHHQLPPVVKNMAFQKYCNMEQSLFTRMVRLGVPYVELDAQGRARSSICNLYRWRYRNLGDLRHVCQLPEYRAANAGLRHDIQLINVDDFNGAGETEPSPYFYQNLAEAEYVVAVFMYMRLIGWPAEKISILTTYNGQKHLIRDVINKRCADNPLIGRPHKVTTVDKYQGQQNDIALISLVRTKAVGHVRDLRRLIVATSRARLGLYIFARASLFRNCFELQPTFNQLLERPLQLELIPGESYPAQRTLSAAVPEELVLRVMDMPHMARYVYDMYIQRVRDSAQDSTWSAPGSDRSARSKEADHHVAVHPGGDSDEDDATAFQPTDIVNEIEEQE